MRKTVLVLAAAATALALAAPSSAGIFVQRTDEARAGEAAVVTFNITRTTTAFALGVWGSPEGARPVTVTYSVDCLNPLNDRAQTFQLVAGRFLADAAFLWIGNRSVGTPWHGWDTCNLSAIVSQTAATDHSLIAWIVSHD